MRRRAQIFDKIALVAALAFVIFAASGAHKISKSARRLIWLWSP